MNLVSNALKFTHRGEVRVSVSCVASTPQTAGMRVAVQDTGVGIPEDKLDLVFEKFSQVDGSNTRRYGGTGLGLAIAKELIALMGGAIAVESRVGSGIDVLVHAAVAARFGLQALMGGAIAGGEPRGSGLDVLV